MNRPDEQQLVQSRDARPCPAAASARRGAGCVVDVVRPADLGEEDLARWAQEQHADPSLHSPFLSPQFALAVGRVRARTRVAVVRDAGGRTGFWPFERRALGAGAALGSGLSDVQGAVLPEGLDVDAAGVLRAAGLRSLAADHLLAGQARLLSGTTARLRPERSPALDLTQGYQAYAARQRERSRSLLQSTARKRRKLEREHGPVRLVLHETDHGVLDRVLAWKSDQYRRTGRRDRFADPATARLVHELLDARDPAFSAPLSVLRAGDRIVAAHLGLRSPTTLAWWFPVYDPGYAAYSPGLVLCLDLAEAAAGDGVRLFDLGKGDEPYKDRLADTGVDLLSGVIATGRAALAARTAPGWPKEQALRVVLRSPRLRGWARASLTAAGRLRTKGGV